MPEIYCAYDKMVKVEDLKPNPRNPNQHPSNQIAMLARIITENGWRAPITVSTRSGYIVRGHGRLQAAIEAGLTECPVDFQDYESDEQELQDLLADNRIAELSENDGELLNDILKELSESGADIELTGFTDLDIDFGSEIEDMNVDDVEDKESSIGKLVINDKRYVVAEDEAELFIERIEEWIAETGLPYGFLRSVLND